MSEPTAEDRRAALVERVAAAMRATREFQAGAAFGVPEDAHVPYATGLAEAVLSLLESGEAGVYLLAGSDVQGTVGIVLGQLREARRELGEALAEIARLRAAGAGCP